MLSFLLASKKRVHSGQYIYSEGTDGDERFRTAKRSVGQCEKTAHSNLKKSTFYNDQRGQMIPRVSKGGNELMAIFATKKGQHTLSSALCWSCIIQNGFIHEITLSIVAQSAEVSELVEKVTN